MKRSYVLLGVIAVLFIVIGAFVLTLAIYKPYAEPYTGPFVGSKNINVYHYPSCHYAERISGANKIWFDDVADARNHGYRPCKVCRPP